MKFGTRLRELRKRSRWSIKTLAKAVKVNHAYLSRIESGQVQPSEQIIRKLARTLRCDGVELMLLADRIPPTWRTTIQKAPGETANFLRESIEEYRTNVEPVSDSGQNGHAARSQGRRKSPAGIATNDLIFSAQIGNNDEQFPQILNLYVASGSTIADITYGRGVFWRQIPKDRYKLKATDLLHGVDCRALPYADGSLDCVVFDPPYMHTPGGTAHRGHQNYEGYYRNNATSNGSDKIYHEAVLDL
jgi:transcriptional regulator with XRE-family HTH domain